MNETNLTTQTSVFNLEQTESIRQYSKWTNLISLLCKISGIITMIIGVPTILAFGVGFIYIGIGFLTYKFGVWYKSSSDAVKYLPDNSSDLNTLKNSLFNIINPLTTINKINAIMTFVIIGLCVLFTLLTIVLIISSPNMLKSNNNYYPNTLPPQSQQSNTIRY